MQKLYTLSLIFLVFISHLSFSQNQDYDENAFISGGTRFPQTSPFVSGVWTSLSNSPHSVSRSCCAYVIVNGTPYLYQFGGGNTSTEARRVARLNLLTNTWQNNYSQMPEQISSGTAIPMNNGNEIYVFGGNNSNLGKTLRYNVNSNSWQTLTDMLTEVTDALVVKYSESTIFIVGGGDGYFGSGSFRSNSIQSYNINTNTYTYRNSYPIPCAMLGGGIYRDTIIAVGGYTSGGVATSSCYKGVINPVTLNITWSPMPSYPLGPIVRLASYVAEKNDGVGIVCTGGALGGSVPTAQTMFWNFCNQSWQSGLPNNSLARYNFKACGTGDNKVYVVAGYAIVGVGNTEYLTISNIEGPCGGMVGVNGNNNSLPEVYELRQNYPNPFNPSTTIVFSLPKPEFVKLTLTDINGREIKVLANKFFTAGSHAISLNAESLSSGIYFYSIAAGEFKDTKKMLLVK
ncbi:MAG: T9SS type A sorting domain-containing protein [Chlorobi bacterium]|nr:T9SS type A sorting domain-containing protein [Chlorobiota bacterium]